MPSLRATAAPIQDGTISFQVSKKFTRVGMGRGPSSLALRTRGSGSANGANISFWANPTPLRKQCVVQARAPTCQTIILGIMPYLP